MGVRAVPVLGDVKREANLDERSPSDRVHEAHRAGSAIQFLQPASRVLQSQSMTIAVVLSASRTVTAMIFAPDSDSAIVSISDAVQRTVPVAIIADRQDEHAPRYASNDLDRAIALQSCNAVFECILDDGLQDE